MRDKRYIAEHRGGYLKKDHQRQLIIWAFKCSEHVLTLCNKTVDERLTNALLIVKEWARGNSKTGDAMKASVNSHAAARDSSGPEAVGEVNSLISSPERA